MTKTLAGILFCATFLFPVAAFGVDGQVLINQSTVMAAGGFPYKITQPGSYKLTGNLTVPANTDGIDINASHVTLDLNGFSLIGPQTCAGELTGPVISCTGSGLASGIVSIGNAAITIRNGSVTGMAGYGLLVSAFGALIEEIHTSQNGVGIHGGRTIVRRCTAASNLRNGMEVQGVVENSIATNNGGNGIDLTDASATENAVFFNTNGISAAGSTVANNTSFLNIQAGLSIDNTSTFRDNSLQGNGTDLQNFGGSSQKNNNCSGAVC